MSQLALAHERQLIQKGCSLHVAVHNAKEDLAKAPTDKGAAAHKDGDKVPIIKLHMRRAGAKQKETLDLDLESTAGNFAS